MPVLLDDKQGAVILARQDDGGTWMAYERKATRQWEDLGQLYPAPGFCNEVQYCFFATDLTPCVAQADEDELIEVVSMSSTQIAQAIQTGEMMDGKSIALYTRAHLRGLV